MARRRLGSKELVSKSLPRLSEIQKNDPSLRSLMSLTDEQLGRAAYGCVVCVEVILKESHENKGIEDNDLSDSRVMLHRLVEIIAFMRQGNVD